MTDEQTEAQIDRSLTDAQRAFDSLTDEQKAGLAKSVFFVLEYDDLGAPGYEWDSDTFCSVALAFADRGVIFTPPRSDED